MGEIKRNSYMCKWINCTTFVSLGNRSEKIHRKEWKLLTIRMRLEKNHSQPEQPTHHPVNKGSVCVFYISAESGGVFYSLQNRFDFNSLLDIIFIVNLDGPGNKRV